MGTVRAPFPALDALDFSARMGRFFAEVVKLVDTLASGASGGNPVEVQVLSSAPNTDNNLLIDRAFRVLQVHVVLSIALSQLVRSVGHCNPPKTVYMGLPQSPLPEGSGNDQESHSPKSPSPFDVQVRLLRIADL